MPERTELRTLLRELASRDLRHPPSSVDATLPFALVQSFAAALVKEGAIGVVISIRNTLFSQEFLDGLSVPNNTEAIF